MQASSVTPHYPRLFGLRRSAVIEIALFLLVALAVDYAFVGGHRLQSISPHPFWVLVLLISVQYGTSEGLLAAAASTVALYLGELPDQQMGQTSYDYLLSVITLPLLWFIAAIMFGELRNKQLRERNQLYEELEIARNREDTIADSYQRLRERKDQLELRITGQLRSSIEAYQAARKMETLQPTDLYSGIVELVKAVLGPDKFSVYQLEGSMLNLVANSGWKNDNEFPRIISSRQTLFQEIVGKQAILSVSNPDHERILEAEGLLAGPLVNKSTGQVMGMLKIEDTGFIDLNLSSIQTFSALCEWIGMAMTNARQYQAVQSTSYINPEHNLMSHGYFQRYANHISAIGKRAKFDVTMLTIGLANVNDFDQERRRRIARTLSECVNRTLRDIDLAFDYTPSGEEFAIILPATNKRGAETVLSKIMKELEEEMPKGVHAKFSTSVQSLAA